jgi:primosomal protein N' (replication factor Y) (superfamily II helicase)
MTDRPDLPGMTAKPRIPQVVEVLLPLALHHPYSYRVTHGLEVHAGDYVRVPLGPRQAIGVVWNEAATPPQGRKLRDVAERFELAPMSALHRRFVDWLAAYYLAPAGLVLRMCLRAPGAFAGPREQIAWRVTGQEPERLTPQRRRVLEIAGVGLALRMSELAEMAGVSHSVVKGLAIAGSLEPVALPALRRFAEPRPAAGSLVLSAAQGEAAGQLREAVARRDFSVSLLDGVTGSGKTEVYFEAMAAALAMGSQVLLLLPEIALTGPFLRRVEERFEAAPAEWHSDARPSERERVWRAVASGEARIVVGARSALFLPWRRPGLIVVDEEHEPAFKQEDGVAYHARDMAVVMGSLGRFPVVLSSATPSLESLVNVDRGRYAHVRLADRYGRPELPPLELVDMRRQQLAAGRWLAEPVAEAVAATIAAGSQALLFLNRRGYAPVTLCRACGQRIECRNCSAWLVEHRFRKQLLCHHCGHAEPVPLACPGCRAEGSLTPCGPGVERLAEEAAQRFAGARTVILSSDLMSGPALRATLDDIARGRYDLIIGTQLVAKGHHFPHLTLACVVDGDLVLETSDPRAGERTWQLLAQVAGRAGRGEQPGRALVQTYVPEHPLMQALKAGDRDGFLSREKHTRETAGLPPYGRLAALIVSGRDQGETEQFARLLARRAPAHEAIQLLGPAPAPLHLVRGRYRWRFLLKAPRNSDLQAFISAWLAVERPRGSLRIHIDIDPYSFV